jgi:hypothetical protein
MSSVTPWREASTVDVIEEARADGFELDEKPLADQWVWAWHRDDDWRWPCYLEEHQALDWMADRLRRIAVFR